MGISKSELVRHGRDDGLRERFEEAMVNQLGNLVDDDL